jgi:gamma-glutamylcyclotransferase (GGCT)/AIG2-like uncharacterized protein YtfP
VRDDAGTSALHRIFVYGSLRRGECNHDVWFGRGVTPVADGYIRGAELVNLGDYCGIVPVADRTRVVVGEVYDLTPEVFRGIEALEAEAGYVRRPVEVYRRSDQDGMPAVAADAYFYPVPDRIAGRPRIASGDWLLRAGRRGA